MHLPSHLSAFWTSPGVSCMSEQVCNMCRRNGLEQIPAVFEDPLIHNWFLILERKRCDICNLWMDLTSFTVLVSLHLMGFPFNPSLPADFMFVSRASGRTCGTGEWGTQDEASFHRNWSDFSMRSSGVLHWPFFLSNSSKTGPLWTGFWLLCLSLISPLTSSSF